MQKLSDLSFSPQDFPQAVMNLLQQNEKVSLVLEKDSDSDEIRIGIRKLYRQEVRDIVRSAREKYALRKQEAGRTREDAAKDFLNAQSKVAQHLTSQNG